jgi:L-lactate dehydrogenase
MKVSIIGGGGRVGADAAFALQLGGAIRDLALIDLNADMAAGEALDITHGAALAEGVQAISGDYDVAAGSDCVVITAGLRRRPDESRLELINRNVVLFREILDSLKQVKLPETATIMVVSNPVDILTQLAVEADILPQKQVFGLGTVLDTCRFRSMLAAHFQIGAPNIHAMILGEHGDSMVPIWSSASVSGFPLRSIPGYNKDDVERIFQATKGAGAEVLRLKGGAGRAVGIAIMTVVHALAYDRGTILPVSSLQNNVLGISGISLSLPTKLGRRGIMQVVEPAISFEEHEALLKSAAGLKEVLGHVSAPASAK